MTIRILKNSWLKADNKSLLLRVNSLEKDKSGKDEVIKDLQEKVTILEEKVDDHEQYSKRENFLMMMMIHMLQG